MLHWNTIGGDDACRPTSGLLQGGEAFPLHKHDFPEVFWVAQGRGIHRINGVEHALIPGVLAQIRASDAHSFHSDATGVTIQNIALRADILAQLRERHFLHDDLFWNGNAAIPVHLQLNPDRVRRLQSAFDELCLGPWNAFSAERFLLNLLHILRQGGAKLEGEKADLPDWLAQALMRWRADSRQLAGGTLALSKLAGRSPEHVARTLRECTGRTPTDWLNDARMTQAARLLAVTNRKILDIAMDCGFASLGHFYSVFLAAHGCAPRAYRMRFLPRPI